MSDTRTDETALRDELHRLGGAMAAEVRSGSAPARTGTSRAQGRPGLLLLAAAAVVVAGLAGAAWWTSAEDQEVTTADAPTTPLPAALPILSPPGFVVDVDRDPGTNRWCLSAHRPGQDGAGSVCGPLGGRDSEGAPLSGVSSEVGIPGRVQVVVAAPTGRRVQASAAGSGVWVDLAALPGVVTEEVADQGQHFTVYGFETVGTMTDDDPTPVEVRYG